eukprot:GHVS01084849.1.p1 GENE.GHVS01084849.1~~GHVS01084849.1.p1  ORF type:complete len:106 (+),score=12.96 GHVS01084849.1:569-886(+)
MFYYSQVKGKIEKCLENMKFSKLFIYRPGLLLCERKEGRPVEGVLRGVATYFDWGSLFSVSCAQVATVMVDNAIQQGNETPDKKKVSIWEHADIVKRAKEIMHQK